MGFLSSFNIPGSALSAQRLHMDIIMQNIANADTVMTEDGEAYRRQKVVFTEAKTFESAMEKMRRQANTGDYSLRSGRRVLSYDGVLVTEIFEDDSPLNPVFDPDHPYADEMGYVYYPNVDEAKEQLDLMAATRSYEANITTLNVLKTMTAKALTIGG